MYHIGGNTYAVVKDHKNGWNYEVFRERYSEVLDRYDFIVGDWGYNQLRLKGFFKDTNNKGSKEASIGLLHDYLHEYCNFGCAYFIIEKLASRKGAGERGADDGDEGELEAAERAIELERQKDPDFKPRQHYHRNNAEPRYRSEQRTGQADRSGQDKSAATANTASLPAAAEFKSKGGGGGDNRPAKDGETRYRNQEGRSKNQDSREHGNKQRDQEHGRNREQHGESRGRDHEAGGRGREGGRNRGDHEGGRNRDQEQRQRERDPSAKGKDQEHRGKPHSPNGNPERNKGQQHGNGNSGNSGGGGNGGNGGGRNRNNDHQRPRDRERDKNRDRDKEKAEPLA